MTLDIYLNISKDCVVLFVTRDWMTNFYRYEIQYDNVSFVALCKAWLL